MINWCPNDEDYQKRLAKTGILSKNKLVKLTPQAKEAYDYLIEDNPGWTFEEIVNAALVFASGDNTEGTNINQILYTLYNK